MKKMILITCLMLITLPELFLPVFAEQMECVITPKILPDPKILNNIPAIGPEDHVLGPEDAVVTFVVYGSLSCFYSRTAMLELMDFQKNHPDEIRLVFRPVFLSISKQYKHNYVLADYALEAAADQNYYFDVLYFLYTNEKWTNYDEWSIDDASEYLNTELVSFLQENGSQWNKGNADFDADQWRKNFTDKDMRKKVDRTLAAEKQNVLVAYTPTTFVNNTVYDDAFSGDYSEENLESLISLFSVQQRSLKKCPDIVTDSGKQYRAVLDTDKGQIDIDLFADKAPLAVNSFVFLAQNGWFDNNPFMQKGTDDFVLQSGDPTGTNYMDAGFTYAVENSRITADQPGLVGMVKNGEGLNNSRFFITYDLDSHYRKPYERLSQYLDYADADEFVSERLESFAESNTIFGRVTSETYDVFLQIEPGDAIRSVTIIAE